MEPRLDSRGRLESTTNRAQPGFRRDVVNARPSGPFMERFRGGPSSAAVRVAGPAVLQRLFVLTYSSLWITFDYVIPGVGRPERLMAIVGLLAVPFAVGGSRRLSRGVPTSVGLGLFGLVAAYVLSFIVHGTTGDSAGYVISLLGRVLFLWLGYALLQNRDLFRQALALLTLSSLVAAGFALAVLARYGLDIGRVGAQTDIGVLAQLGDLAVVLFSASQMAPIGAVLLLGLSTAVAVRYRWLAMSAAGTIFAASYLSYFRREILVTVPLVLIAFQLTAGSSIRTAVVIRRLLVMTIGLVALVGWEYSRDDSVLRQRVDSEICGFVASDETRIANARAELDVISESPMLGHGPGSHASVISPEKYSQSVAVTNLNSFNLYLWLAVEAGLAATLCYVLILVGVSKEAWRWRKIRGSSAEAIVLRCGPTLVLQIALWGMFGNAWETPVAWFIMGMILAAARLAATETSAPPLGRSRIALAGPLRRGWGARV